MTDIIIIGYHGERWLPDCLSTLPAAGGRGRLVLVDNGGNGDLGKLPFDRTAARVLITARSMGFAEANNFALQQVGLDVEAVCFLNQDTRSEPGWLDACLECLERYPDVGAVSPLLRTYDDDGWDPNFHACAGASPELLRDLEQRDNLADFYEVPQATAAALVVRSDVLRQVGPFDPIYGSYYEDYDLCLRIRRAGYRVGFCGQAVVRHYCGSSTTTKQAERKRMRQVMRNRAILRFREAGAHRLGAILKYFTSTFPRNLGRGVFRTPSSQPVGLQLAAHASLLSTLPRLASARRDERAWSGYLRVLGWPGRNGTAADKVGNG